MFPFSAWIPNGAQPFGIFGSLKASGTGAKEALKVSTLALWKSVAYSWSFSVANPSNDAPADVSSTAVTAVVPFTDGAQPRIWPASVSNKNRAELLTPLWVTTKSAVFEFATVP